MTTNPVDEFWRRVHEEWLPVFCEARGYSADGFKIGKKVISPIDATDFLRAMQFLSVNKRGQFRVPQSKAFEVIFWEDSDTITPRPIYPWIEPILTIAAIARLHLDFGWPLQCLGMQSKKWEFDLTGFLPGNLEDEFLAGEVKSSNRELDSFLVRLQKCCSQTPHDCSGMPKPQINAHKKWQGLMRARPKLFWALGPGNYSHVFKVEYHTDGTIALRPTPDESLRYQL